MSNERIIPNQSKSDFVTFDLLSEGKQAEPTLQVLSCSVTKAANKIPSARIVIKDGNPAKEDFEVSSKDSYIPGKNIEIKAGKDGNNTTIFKGIVVKHAIKIRALGDSVLVVDCKDESVKMTIGRQNAYFDEKKDSEIMKEVLGKYGLAGKIEATKVKHKEVIQNYVTDWDFLLSRAEANGMLVMADDGKVNIQPPEVGSAALTLIYGSTLLDFEAEMDARNQWSKVVGQAWDYASQKLFKATSSSSSFKEWGDISGAKLADAIGLSEYELRHGGQVMTEELKAWTDACMLKSRLAKIRGRAKFKGFAEVKPGSTIELKGVGSRFSGDAFVTAVAHELVAGQWLAHAEFGLDPKWASENSGVREPAAGGLVPGVNGLQVGKVVKLEDDPDGQDRIQVKIPVIDENAQGIWARIGTLDAGKERGSFFRPEIDDEVIVGFINDDPRDAVVLGMMHSSKNPAPIKATDTNHEKGFVTRSKMRVWFDDEKKIMTLDTPASNLIEISEEGKSITIKDQNDNKIILNEQGIEINSPKDIKIIATGKIEATATQDLKAEGLNVEIKAKAAFKAEGQAGADLKTSAIATIKGSLVKIN